VRVLLISVTPLWHRRFGKAVVMAGIMTFLREVVPPGELGVVTLSLDEEPDVALPELVEAVPKPSGLTRLAAMLLTLVAGRRSLQEAVYASSSTARGVARAVERFAPDLILCDTLRVGQFFLDGRVDPHGARLLIYLDDLYSERYDAMLQVASHRRDLKINAIGNFGRMLPGPLARLLALRPVQHSLLKLERDRISARERLAPTVFERCLLVNNAEAALLRNVTGARNILTLKPFLPEPTAVARKFDGRAEFVFLGDLAVPHNEVSTYEFITHTLSALRESMPTVRLRVIGTSATPRLLELAARHPDVVSVEGFVPDLDAVLSTCTALVAPLLFGSGVKLKVLEALGRGVPVVGTNFGVQGINVPPGAKYLVVLNDFNEYPSALHALTDVAINEAASREAYAFYRETYGTEVVRREYAQALFASTSRNA